MPRSGQVLPLGGYTPFVDGLPCTRVPWRGQVEVIVTRRAHADLERAVRRTQPGWWLPVGQVGVSDLVARAAPPWAEVPMILPPSGKPRVYGEVPGTEATLALVSLGCGVGVVPRLVADQSPLRSTLKVLSTEQALSPVRVGICTERKRLKSPVVNAFWESIQPPG